MDRVLMRLDKFALLCLDVMAILSKSRADHVEHIRIILRRLKEAGLTVNPVMLQLGCVEVNHLVRKFGRW